jgi:hypothetical protein
MNAHERKKSKRMAKKLAADITAKQNACPEDRKDLQADKKASHKGETPQEAPLDHCPSRVLKYAGSTGKWLWKVTLFLGFWLGIVSGYTGLLQRISVSQNDQLDPNDTFSSPFIVSHDGPLPIENVRFRCGIGYSHSAKGPDIKGSSDFGSSFIFLPDANGKLPPQNFGSAEMNPGERSTLSSCPYPFPKPVEVADIGIVVIFRVGYTPITATRIFRFATISDADKRLHWFPFPLK